RAHGHGAARARAPSANLLPRAGEGKHRRTRSQPARVPARKRPHPPDPRSPAQRRAPAGRRCVVRRALAGRLRAPGAARLEASASPPGRWAAGDVDRADACGHGDALRQRRHRRRRRAARGGNRLRRGRRLMTAVGESRPPWFGIAELVPDWEAPPRVRAFVTGRRGGVSRGPWGLSGGEAGGLNLGMHCGDVAADVAENRARLLACLPASPRWLRQVHGAAVLVARAGDADASATRGPAASADAAFEPEADAAVTADAGVVLAVLTADCLPVLLTDTRGRAVALAHAGWRGMALGVLERGVDA